MLNVFFVKCEKPSMQYIKSKNQRKLLECVTRYIMGQKNGDHEFYPTLIKPTRIICCLNSKISTHNRRADIWSRFERIKKFHFNVYLNIFMFIQFTELLLKSQ